MIQLIDKHKNIFCIRMLGEIYHFIPPTYLSRNFLPIIPVVKGSTLGWNIEGKFISYNQIKKAIKSL